MSADPWQMQCRLEEELWLADVAAQAEYFKWLDEYYLTFQQEFNND